MKGDTTGENLPSLSHFRCLVDILERSLVRAAVETVRTAGERQPLKALNTEMVLEAVGLVDTTQEARTDRKSVELEKSAFQGMENDKGSTMRQTLHPMWEEGRGKKEGPEGKKEFQEGVINHA